MTLPVEEVFAASPEFSEAVARCAGGKTPASCVRIQGGGYTQARRLLMRFTDGSSVFIKAATTPDTANWLQSERRVYEAMSPAAPGFLPVYYGSGEADGFPFLVLEDLSGAHWPPPWTDAHIRAVLDALAEVPAAVVHAPADLPRLASYIGEIPTWNEVAADPEEFLSLGLCSREWLDTHLPTLMAATAAAPFAGDDLIHLDIRSDNLCFRPDGRAVIVDWNHACIGNSLLEVAGWLPSLHAEGGPPPEAILPDGAAEFAAWLAGYWARQAGKPAPPGAPHLRGVQKRQLAVSLPWAARALGLPEPA
jgi:hypothetical protein